jgi:hypothetical protein
MKDKITTTILICLMLVSVFSVCITVAQNNTSKTYVYNFKLNEIKDITLADTKFSEILIDNCTLFGDTGEPALPVYTTNILIPAGKQIENIEVSANLKSMDFLKNPIQPKQECTIIGENDTDFAYNQTCYKSQQLVLDGVFTNNGIQYARGYPILSLTLFPVNYKPYTNKIQFYDSITITITYSNGNDANMFLRDAESDREHIATFVENPGDIGTYGYAPLDGPLGYTGGLCDTSQLIDYVIITSNSLNDTTGEQYNWSSLIDHRYNFSGLNGTIVTVEQIDECSDYWNDTALFNDSQAHIREFCKDAYLDWETQYILLGGDWRDGTPSQQCVPYRLFTDRFETDAYKTMPCDLYYSNLDGNWWYSGVGGMWGGGQDGTNDIYSELYVGRITAYNASMVSNAVSKILWYDLNATGNWIDTCSFWGGNLGWTVTSKQYIEEIRNGAGSFSDAVGFEEWNIANPNSTFNTAERLYHADLGSNYKNYFIDSITNNNASIINHLDHSGWDTPFGLPNWLYIYNTKPFVGYSQGCLAGRFNSGYSGCEQLMCRFPERNAFALILNTGYGYGSRTNTYSPSQYMQKWFWDYFFNTSESTIDNWQLGKAQAYSKDKLGSIINVEEDHAWAYVFYSSHLFGDPAQELRTQQLEYGQFINPYPPDGSAIIGVYGRYLNMSFNGLPNDNSTISFYWGNDSLIETYTNISNGTRLCVYLPDYIDPAWLSHDTTYTWYVIAENSTSNLFSFKTSKAWDLNEDGKVSITDASMLVNHFGISGLVPGQEPSDINEDGQVSITDASSLLNHYGEMNQ